MLDFHMPYRYTQLQGTTEVFEGYIVGAMPYRRNTRGGVLHGVTFVGIGADPLTRILFNTSVLASEPDRVVLQGSARPNSPPLVCIFRPLTIEQYRADQAAGLMWGFTAQDTTGLVVALQSEIPDWWERKFTTDGASIE